jgi:predicted kinase
MAKPRLYLFVGAPGAGKTTLSKAIAEKSGAKHLWADAERRRLFKTPTHSEAESNQLYEQLNNAAEYLLAQGKSVIFDTNFNFHADRQKLRDIADSQKAETIVIWMTTPKEVAKKRAVCPPDARNGYIEGMTEEQFDAIVNKLEPPHKDENVIKIDGSKLDVKQALTLLKL